MRRLGSLRPLDTVLTANAIRGSALHYRSNLHPVLLLRANDLSFRATVGHDPNGIWGKRTAKAIRPDLPMPAAGSRPVPQPRTAW